MEDDISDWLKDVIDTGIYFLEESIYRGLPPIKTFNYKYRNDFTEATRIAINIQLMSKELGLYQTNWQDYE